MINPLIRWKLFYGWWVLYAAMLGSVFVSGVGNWTLTILITPMSEDLGWSHAQILGSLTVAGLSGAVISPLVGRIVDRKGARIVIPSGLLLLGLSVVLTARTHALWQFYALYSTGLGVSQSAISRVGAQTIASNWFNRNRGIAFGTLMAGSTLSGVAFTTVSQAIVDQWDWRMVWLILGLGIILVPFPIGLLVIRRRPEDVGLHPDGDSAPTAPALEQFPRSHDLGAAEESWTVREATKTRAFWLLNVGLMLIGFPSFSIIVVMHPYFTELGVSSATAAQMVGFYAISSFVGALLWSILLQHWPVRALLIPSSVAYGAAIVLFRALGEFSSVPLLYFSILILGLNIMGISQIGNQVWADYYGRKEIGSIIGMSNLIRTVPLAAGPLLAGAIHDTMGSYPPAFTLFAAFCFIAAVAFFFAKPPRRMMHINEGSDQAIP